MATIAAPPAALQPCEHARRPGGALRPPPRAWSGRRRCCQVIRATATSRGRPSATGSGQLESTALGASAGGEDGDVIRRLQNGPDVRGVALEGEKGRAVDLTPLAVEVIGESFGEWLRDQRPEGEDGEQLRVSVGRDPRLSGSRLSAVLFAGLAKAGCAVFDMGLATTPACFMSTILPRFSYDASIM
ncbi:hypothetical protein CFC21_103605, partial [Triticum aestivum]